MEKSNAFNDWGGGVIIDCNPCVFFSKFEEIVCQISINCGTYYKCKITQFATYLLTEKLYLRNKHASLEGVEAISTTGTAVTDNYEYQKMSVSGVDM